MTVEDHMNITVIRDLFWNQGKKTDSFDFEPSEMSVELPTGWWMASCQ
jgi:hypothetical protein